MFDIRFDLKRYPMSFRRQQQTVSYAGTGDAARSDFLDEPFSALDFEMTWFIRDKLQNAVAPVAPC